MKSPGSGRGDEEPLQRCEARGRRDLQKEEEPHKKTRRAASARFLNSGHFSSRSLTRAFSSFMKEGISVKERYTEAKRT